MADRINFDELVDGFNRKTGLALKTPRELLSYLYNEKKLTVQQVEQELGISYSVVICKMNECGIKRRPSGKNHLGDDTSKRSLFNGIPDEKLKEMTSYEISKAIGSTQSYARTLANKAKRDYKRVSGRKSWYDDY